jgi:hypothetical protein
MKAEWVRLHYLENKLNILIIHNTVVRKFRQIFYLQKENERKVFEQI